VIFFDEFDSLAPRRGHDSTGVTDRVVNQLLTELDGVKSLEGVFVLGATSRPDLLDPALLRSGRIDRIVQCKMPSQQDRVKIIESIGKNLTLDNNVKIDFVAKKTNNFTGADIKSLLTTANMLAIEEFMQTKSSDLSEFDRVVIGSKHVLQALEDTKLSLNERDLKKYEKLYEKFVSKTTLNTQNVSKKISLA
jgi:peroxin-1